MSQITITAKGSYPFGHTLPEALVAGLVAEIETHMRAYGIAGVEVDVMQEVDRRVPKCETAPARGKA